MQDFAALFLRAMHAKFHLVFFSEGQDSRNIAVAELFLFNCGANESTRFTTLAPYCGYNFNFCGGWILTKTYLFFTVFVFVDGHFVGGIDNPLLRLLFSRTDHSRIPCCHVQRTTTIWTRTKP